MRRVDIERAAELYRQGRSLPRIARALGCDTGNLSRALRAAGVEMRPTNTPRRSVDEDRAVQLYQEGQGLADVARAVDCTRQRLRQILVRRGVAIRRVGAPRGQRRRALSYDKEFERARPLIWARSGRRCEARLPGCQGRAVHVHHRRPRGRGGSNDPANLLATCRKCHVWIHDHPLAATRRGLLVPTRATEGAVKEASPGLSVDVIDE